MKMQSPRQDDMIWAFTPLGSHGNVYIVAIEGIIGTGKSTLMKRMQSERMLQTELQARLGHAHVHVSYMLEPVEKWRKTGMLQDFYAHKRENAYPFQVQVFEDYVIGVRRHIAPYINATGEHRGLPMVLVTERSVFSQLLFWRQQEDDGHTTETQRTRYMRQWHSWTHYIPAPKMYIFLRVPHESDKTCATDDERMERELRRVQRRVQARGRGEETPTIQRLEANRDAMKTSIGNQDDNGQVLDAQFMQYNKQLLLKHEAYWPTPLCNPEDKLLRDATCIHLDASRAYNLDDAVLKQCVVEMATHLAACLIRDGYGLQYKPTPQ